MKANPRAAPVFAFYLALIVFGITAATVIGLVRTRDDPAAGRAVERFGAAIRGHDGAAACHELSDGMRKALEDQEKKSCEEAVLGLGLTGGRVRRIDVAERSAKVDVAEDGSAFLDETAGGWKISALGCTPVHERPYECEAES